MSLDRVVEEILDLGRRESKEIIESARKERERMLSEVTARGEDIRRSKEKQAEEEISREQRREVARAELEAKRTILQAQREVLDQVIERARERLKETGPHQELLKSLVNVNRDEIAAGTVLCNRKDAPILRQLVDADVREELDGIGGFIVESKDKSRRVNLAFETLLDDLWEDALKEIAGILWKEE